MDNLLIITIAGIFLAAFLASMIRYRTVDHCLKGFSGFLTTIEFKDTRRAWGCLRAYHNGIELAYLSPHLDSSGAHFETSFILYQSQYGQISAFVRYHDELSSENQARRELELRRTYHPGVFRRLNRKIRNLFNLVRDAFGQALSVLMGSLKKTTSSAIVQTHDGRIQDTAKQLIGASISAYEPILERYIGHRVVLEMERDGKMVEYCGVLKDYTDAFITLLDVPVNSEHAFDLADFEQLEINRDLDFEIESEPAEESRVNIAVVIRNLGPRAIHLCHVEGQGYSRVINMDVEPGSDYRLRLERVPLPQKSEEVDSSDESSLEPIRERPVLPQLRLWIRGSRRMDMVVPRTLGFVRHGADSVGGMSIRFNLNLINPLRRKA